MNLPQSLTALRRSRRLSADLHAAMERARQPIDLSQWDTVSLAHLMHDVEAGTLTARGEVVNGLYFTPAEIVREIEEEKK